MKIQFKDLGRERFNGAINIANELSTAQEIAEIAYKEAKRHVFSRFPDTEYDAEKNEGVVLVGGYRLVGTFSVVKD